MRHTISYDISVTNELEFGDYQSKYIKNIIGTIYASDEDANRTKIGSFEVTRIDIGDALAYNDESLYDITDETQSISDVFCALFDRHYELKKSVKKTLGADLASGNFYLLECMEINPEWRGANIGLAVFAHFMRHHIPVTELVVLEPGPLSKDIKNETKKQIKDRALKLADHWKKLRFKKLLGSRYYGFSTQCEVPVVKMLVKA